MKVRRASLHSRRDVLQAIGAAAAVSALPLAESVAAAASRKLKIGMIGSGKVGGALPELGKTLADLLKGKIIIDTCNPFPDRDGEIANRALAQGAGLVSAELLPGARIVRAFNLIMAARMGRAHEEPQRFGMPITGDDEEAIQVASRLIRDIGYEPVLIGGLEMAKYLMPHSPLSGERAPEEIRRIAATL